MDTFSPCFSPSTNILKYVQRRIKIYKAFTYQQAKAAHLDFTTAFYISKFSEEGRSKWMAIAADKLVSLADVKDEAESFTSLETSNDNSSSDSYTSGQDTDEAEDFVALPVLVPFSQKKLCTKSAKKKKRTRRAIINTSKASLTTTAITLKATHQEILEPGNLVTTTDIVLYNSEQTKTPTEKAMVPKLEVATDYMAMYFKLKEFSFPAISVDLSNTPHESLRRVAGECGLQTSRSSKVLRKDLQLIKQGQHNKIPLCNWKQTSLIAQPPVTIDELKSMINLQNVPDLVKQAILQYKQDGYSIISGILSEEQMNLAKEEWNYHTTSRGIDLNDKATWENINGHHDWKQGWAKWLYTTGVQIFMNTHPLLFMLVAALNNSTELLCNFYDAKIHLPNTGGAFFHNDLNWFKYYENFLQVGDTDVQSPQIVVFLTNTIEGKSEFYIIPSMYHQEKWEPLVKGLYNEHSHKYKAVSAMNITELCPDLLQECVAVTAKAGDILIFHPRVTHGISDNLSSGLQLRCYPCLGLASKMPNSAKEVMTSYTTGSHPKRYAHYYTGNPYKQKLAFARSARPHFVYPVNHIAGALLGVRTWTDIEVQYNLCALFSHEKQLQETFIQQWISEYFEKWKALVATQIALYGDN